VEAGRVIPWYQSNVKCWFLMITMERWFGLNWLLLVSLGLIAHLSYIYLHDMLLYLYSINQKKKGGGEESSLVEPR
jgi:hypothetical protein